MAETTRRSRSGPLVRIYAILIIDGIIGSLVYPAFPRFVAKTAHPELWYGVALTLFALLQFMAAPLLGLCADSFGRRPVFRIAAIGTFVAGLFNLPVRLLPFLGNRVLDGTTNGLYAVVKSAIADISSPEDTQRNLGFTATLSYAGFIVGPAVSLGILGLADWLNVNTVRALIIGGLIFASINIAISLGVPETSTPSHSRISLKQAIRVLNPWSYFERLRDLRTHTPRLGQLIIVSASLAFSLGYYTYFGIFAARSAIHLDERAIAIVFFYFAILGVVTNSLFFTKILPKIHGDRWMRILSFAGAPVIVMYGLSGHRLWLLYVTLTLDMLSYALLPGLIEGLIGLEADPDRKGEIFGIVQGLAALLGVIATASYTLFSTIDLRLPFFVFAGASLLTALLTVRVPKG